MISKKFLISLSLFRYTKVLVYFLFDVLYMQVKYLKIGSYGNLQTFVNRANEVQLSFLNKNLANLSVNNKGSTTKKKTNKIINFEYEI